MATNAQIMNNKLGDRVTLVVTATGSANVTGNTSTCDIALADRMGTTETINSVQISQIWFSISNGTLTIARGANTVLILDGTDHFRFSEHGSSLSLYSTAANVVYTFSAGSIGSAVIELQKQVIYNYNNAP